MNDEKNPQGTASRLTIPVAIVIAGVLIAGAVFVSNKGRQQAAVLGGVAGQKNAPRENPGFNPISADDHLLGSPKATVTILEYSDTECPFCKSFHATLHRIINEYGKTGQVAWVYRHFPLDAIHPKTRKEAEATECAAQLGGNEKFWEYIDRVFEITPSNNGLDPTLLPQIAANIGLDRSAFETCLASDKYAAKVEAQYQDAVRSGGQGTPHSFLIAGTSVIPFSGAQPYASVKSTLNALLSTPH